MDVAQAPLKNHMSCQRANVAMILGLCQAGSHSRTCMISRKRVLHLCGASLSGALLQGRHSLLSCSASGLAALG